MKNFVTCNNCVSWNFEQQMSRDCSCCKNKRLIIEPKDVLCNNCGLSMCPIGSINGQIPHGLVNARVVGGFDSYHLFDTTSYTFSLCEFCLRNLFMTFFIKPTISETDLNEIDTGSSAWDKDLLWYEERLWEDSSGPEEAYKNGKCNSKKDCAEDAIYSLYSDNEFTTRCACEKHKNNKVYYNTILKPFVPHSLRAFI